jgi:hypothetical protein
MGDDATSKTSLISSGFNRESKHQLRFAARQSIIANFKRAISLIAVRNWIELNSNNYDDVVFDTKSKLILSYECRIALF